jgi:NAD(P)-dependent dehydrogenase (short-subunit alcohol dehydrogenase family)
VALTSKYKYHQQQHVPAQQQQSNYYSTFQPPENNKYHGTPVYNNIDIHASPSKVSTAATARNTDPEAVFVVSGASRSMGLQFVKELFSRTKGRIVACVMRPGSAPALDSFLNGLTSPEERSRIAVHRLDVTNIQHIEQLAKDIGENYGRVDGLYNVAGVLGDKESTPGPEMNLSQLDATWASDQMAVNAIGPMMLTANLAGLLKARKGRNNYLRSTGAQESIVVNLSARVASMDDNQGGLAWYTYRMSKAALNAGVRASSHELRRQGTWTVALYPGMTDTAMSVPFQTEAMRAKGLVFPVEFTVGRLMDVVDRMEEEHSGGFYDWAGQAIPF